MTFISLNLVSIVWTQPINDGGCPIISYHIYSNQGEVINSFIEIDENDVTNKPFLSSYEIFTVNWTPSIRYKLKMGVENHIGELISDSTEFLLASVPSTPELPTRISNGETF